MNSYAFLYASGEQSLRSTETITRRYLISVSNICKLSAIRCSVIFVIIQFSMVGVAIIMVKLAGGCVNRACCAQNEIHKMPLLQCVFKHEYTHGGVREMVH